MRNENSGYSELGKPIFVVVILIPIFCDFQALFLIKQTFETFF